MSLDEPTEARAHAVAETLGAEAGALLLRGFRTGAEVRKKGRIDLVTEFDLASEALLRAGIADAFPEHRIVAEEGQAEGTGEVVWYVDPLDGTTNFAHGHPFFSVSIALYDGDRPVLGVVVAPALGITWSGRAGHGARRNGVPCRVSETRALEDALCATGFPYDRWTNPDDNTREMKAFLKCTQGVRRCGSAAIDLALVADGTYDLYWEKSLSAWDMAAGALLVQEAGGRLSDTRGAPGDPRTGELLATNPHLQSPALRVLGTRG